MIKKLFSQLLGKTALTDPALLENLNTISIVTDPTLKILSANAVAERTLSVSRSELVNQNMMDVFFLKDSQGAILNDVTLNLEKIIADKKIFQMQNLFLLVKNSTAPRQVNLQIKPIANFTGSIDQLIVLITELNPQVAAQQAGKHSYLEQAQVNQEALIQELKTALLGAQLWPLATKAELISRAEQDILNAIEIEDRAPGQHLGSADIAQMLQKIVTLEQSFASNLNVSVEFTFLNFSAQDISPHIPQGMDISPNQFTSLFFIFPVDLKWFELLIRKLLTICVLISTGSTRPEVLVSLEHEGKTQSIIRVSAHFSPVTAQELGLLFVQYYGDLDAKTNLRLGSGLEGFLAKTIAYHLKIPLLVRYVPETSRIQFEFKLVKSEPAVS